MYIKRLELIGFKSFADRTEIELSPGITAVVGPNGSGKSNIAEALRWVLGEQSAKSLRGARMEDVIFAGSDGRKPINFCEVSLTLDNEDGRLPLDYREITVTRRLYRSGESEYSINRQSCRLKDVIDLFMDTGLGKEAYSMIGQGRIDEVLSNRPEDRRGMFEDAAGIVKFKARKREALKKLEETRNNLVRIDDVIHELREQAAPLEEEAERERAFRVLHEEARDIEGRLMVWRIEQTHRELREVEQHQREAALETASAHAAVEQAEMELQERRLALTQLEKDLEALQEAWSRERAEQERDEGQRRVLAERAGHLDRTLHETRTRLEGLRERRATLVGELDRLRMEAEEAARVVEAQERQLRETQPGTEAEERRTRERLEQLKGDLIDRLNRAAAARNEYRHRLEALQTARSRRDRLQAEVNRRREEIVAAEAQVAKAQEQVAEAERELHAKEQKRQDLLRRLERVSRDAREVESRWRRDREQLASLSSKWDVMRELEESYGGYGRGAKAVLQAAKSGKLSGVCGAVAELIQVPEGLEVAVETALGPAVQHVVVQEENDGRRAIEFLKTLREGRVTCIPLSVIRPRLLPEEDRRTLASLDGWIGVAADLVEAETVYRHLVENLLGQVVIARDLRAALEMARRTRHRYRIVTLDGDVVHPGGTMSGGAPARSGSNLLARRRQLEQMRRDVEQLQRRVGEFGARFGDLERLKEDLSRQMEQMEADLDAAEGELRARQERLQRFLSETKGLRERLDWDLFELGRLEEEIAGLESRLHEAEKTSQMAEQDAHQTREEIDRLEAKWQTLQADAERRRAEVTELRVNLASLKERYLYVTEQQREKASQLAAVDAESAALDEEVKRLERERDETVRALEEMSVRLNRRRDEAARRLEKLEEAREARRRAADALQEAEERVAGLRDIWRKCEQQLHTWAVRRERLQVELRHALDALAENFRLGFERAKERFAPVEDPAPLQTRLDGLRRQMDAMGPVRTGAVEDYERLRERLDFLQRQRDDLLAASSRLDEVIRDIDAEMSARFLKTVEAVNARFQDVFVHLFGGGRAYLELTDPADPLGTGVEIVAQPPGKKLQTLSLLSGGERALTAIALLFAILQVNPVPVCVLDEVDAALDEANVHRFARYLREFSTETQFVVITHRKGTMEQADALYGVSMEEAGVSKLVAVRLVDPESEEKSAS